MLWYETENKEVTLSTRIRLARNLDGVPFPSRLDPSRLRKTVRNIADTVLSCDVGVKLREIDIESLGDSETYALVERHSISPEFAAKRDGRILLLSDDESVSIMVGEEDHLRIQVLLPGMRLTEAYAVCDRIDTVIGQKFKFAFDEKLGFLTECPTNLGTGLRASLMLHLPVLASTGELSKINDSASKIGLTFRGFYGEGSNSKAGIYQLSNQITLGVSERTALENLETIASQIAEKELQAEKSLDRETLFDTVCRSVGLLRFARRMDTSEMMKHLSYLMLGERTGTVSLPEGVLPMKLFITLQPAMLKRVNGDIDSSERDKIRAEQLRNELKTVDI